jgi:hypothetical protein
LAIIKAVSGAKTQAGYAIVGLKNSLENNKIG